MVGIYKITNPSGKIYIGQSIDIKKRFYAYKKMHCKGQKKLYHSLLKYGVENHKFEIIEECEIADLNEKERYYQELYSAIGTMGLNCMYVKNNSKSGVMSKEAKEKMRISHLKEKNIMFGKTHSKEAKEKISKTHKGRKLTDKHKKKIKQNSSKYWLGKKRSDEMKLKLKEYRTGLKMAQETKNKISISLKGRKFSEEHRRKIGEANSRRTLTQETRQKWSKKVIDTKTGIVYNSIKEAAFVLNISYSTLQNRISNNTKTTLRYANRIFF